MCKRQYCGALPGTTLHGVTMPADKVVLNGTAIPSSFDAFMTDFISLRVKKSGDGKGKAKLSSKSLECYVDAISFLRERQKANELDRFTDLEQEKK